MALKSAEELKDLSNKVGALQERMEAAEKEAKTAPEVVASTPKTPGPMGILGPLRFGMTLAEARAAQPGLRGKRQSGHGPRELTPDDTVRLGDATFAFHQLLPGAPDAFPWDWSAHADLFDPEKHEDAWKLYVGLNFSGEVVEVEEDDEAWAATRVTQMDIELYDEKPLFDIAREQLTTLWGAPQVLELSGSDKDAVSHTYTWRDVEAGHCVVMKDVPAHENGRRYSIVVQPCMSLEALLAMTSAPAGTEGALLGMSFDGLQERFGTSAIKSVMNAGRMVRLRLPMWAIGSGSNDDTLLLYLDAKSTVAALSWSSTGSAWADDASSLEGIKAASTKAFTAAFGDSVAGSGDIHTRGANGEMTPTLDAGEEVERGTFLRATQGTSFGRDDASLETSTHVTRFCGQLRMPNWNNIQCSDPEISNIDALAHQVGMRSLGLGDTAVADLSGLGGMGAILHDIDISNTRVTNLSELSGAKSLRYVDISNTPVSDIGPLSTVENLHSLEAHGTKISDLSPLSKLTSLRELTASKTGVTSLSPLSGLTELESVLVGETGVSDISPLTASKGLEKIGLNETKVSDISPLSGIDTLEFVFLDDAPVADLGPISAAKASLETVSVSGTSVSELSAVEGAPKLEKLFVSRTQVNNLESIATLNNLKVLALADTPVSDIASLASLTQLQILDISGSPVSDLSPLKTLTDLAKLVVDSGADSTPLKDLSGLEIVHP